MIKISLSYAVKIFFFILIVIPLTGGAEILAGNITFNPAFSVEQSYHENVFYLTRFEAADYVTLISAEFPWEYSDPSKTFLFRYIPYREIFREYNGLDNSGHLVRSFLDYQGRKWNLRISEAFSATQKQGEQLEIPEYPVGVLRRTDILSNSLGLRYGLKISKLSSLNIALSHSFLKYDDLPDYSYEDSTIVSSRLENLFDVKSDIHQLGYFYQFQQFQYETLDDQESHALGMMYKYSPSEKTDATFRIGRSRISAIGMEQDDETEPLLHVDVFTQFRRSSVLFALSRDTGIARGLPGLSINVRSLLSYSYRLKRYSTFSISSAFYRRRPFQEFLEYDSFSIDSKIDIRFYRKWVAKFSHRYVVQDSEVSDELDASYHFVSVSLSLYPRQESFLIR